MALISFRECFSEFMGPLALVYFGGWIIIRAMMDMVDPIAVGLVHAATISAFSFISANRSACHFNPSITLGYLATGGIAPIVAAFYLISQLIGAFVGTILLNYTVPNLLRENSDIFYGMPRVGGDLGWLAVSFMEFFGTFVLAIAHFSLTENKKMQHFAPAIGCLYGLCIMCLGEYNGTSMNPAKYLGPALFDLKLGDVIFYVLPSIVGGVGGAFAYDFLFKAVKMENVLNEELKAE